MQYSNKRLQLSITFLPSSGNFSPRHCSGFLLIVVEAGKEGSGIVAPLYDFNKYSDELCMATDTAFIQII